MALDKKQKILIPIIILLFAFVGWQAYDLFFRSKQSALLKNRSKAQTQMAALQKARAQQDPQQATTTTELTEKRQTETRKPSVIHPAEQKQAQLQSVEKMEQPPLSADQAEYLRLVNEYQIAKMQRLLYTEEAAIVAAKDKIAKLQGQTPGIDLGTRTTGVSAPQEYRLMYIDYQAHRWTATLNRGGRFHEVRAGTKLPDGTRVLRIDHEGVTVRKPNGDEVYLTFAGNFPATKSTAEEAKLKKIEFIKKPKRQVKKVTVKKRVARKPTVKKQTVVKKKVVRKQKIQKKPLEQHRQAIAEALTTHFSTKEAPVNAKTKPGNKAKAEAKAKTKEVIAQPKQTKIKQQSTAKKHFIQKIQLQPQQISMQPVEITPSLKSTSSGYEMAKKPAINEKPRKVSQSQESLIPLTPEQHKTLRHVKAILGQHKATTQSYTRDEKELLALPSKSYTLQLMGARKLNELKNFAKTNPVSKDCKVRFFHTYYLGKNWYVLVCGDFKTREQAMKQMMTLPPAVQRLKPWVRPMISVQSAIRSYRRSQQTKNLSLKKKTRESTFKPVVLHKNKKKLTEKKTNNSPQRKPIQVPLLTDHRI